MDTEVYTIVGTLSAIVITQVANYYLESKRSKDRIAEMSLELETIKINKLASERKQAYAEFFAALDIFFEGGRKGYDEFLVKYYNAMLMASPKVVQKIVDVYNVLKPEQVDVAAYIQTKESLLIEIHRETKTNA